jgi:hypothetical protein
MQRDAVFVRRRRSPGAAKCTQIAVTLAEFIRQPLFKQQGDMVVIVTSDFDSATCVQH